MPRHREIDEVLAKNLIGLMGITCEDDGDPIPKPSTTEPAHEHDDMVAWVDVDLKGIA